MTRYSLSFGPHESALEQGWLLSEMEYNFDHSLEDVARRFDRSKSWVVTLACCAPGSETVSA